MPSMVYAGHGICRPDRMFDQQPKSILVGDSRLQTADCAGKKKKSKSEWVLEHIYIQINIHIPIYIYTQKHMYIYIHIYIYNALSYRGMYFHIHIFIAPTPCCRT